MTRRHSLLRVGLSSWPGWLAISLLTWLSAACAVLSPWPIKLLIDHVLGGIPLSGDVAIVARGLPWTGTRHGLLLWVACSGLALFALSSAVDVLLTLAWARVGQGSVYTLAAELFAQLQRRSLIFHSRSSVGDAIARITGDSWCVHTLASSVLTPLHLLLSLSGMLVLASRMDPALTLIAFAVAPLSALGALLLRRAIRARARTRRALDSQIHAHVHQSLSGIAVVQGFGQEQREATRLRGLWQQALHAQQRGALLSALSRLSAGLSGSVGLALVAYAGARRVLAGELTVGALLVFLAYVRNLQGRLQALRGSYGALQGTSASIERVREILERAPEVQERSGALPLTAARGALVFERVVFGYEPDRPVLSDVSLQVAPGEVIAIVGPTGAGKSTLAGLVPRFFDPWSGRVLLDGHDLRDLQLASLRSQVALVLQDSLLLPVSVADNIAYGRPGASRADIEAAAREAQAHDFIMALSNGYDSLLSEQGATLSGGERQRIAIARAILKDAPIIVLDEPTSALDPQNERAVMQALARLRVGRTMLVIAHRLTTIRDADRIVLLQGGKIREVGTHSELLDRDGDYARLCRAQSARRALQGPELEPAS